MRSIRTKTTLLTAFAVTLSVAVCTIIGAISSAQLGHSKAEQALSLLCESGKHNLNSYFKSVEQSINTVSDLIDSDLNQIPDENFNVALSEHVEVMRGIFANAAANTAGVLTFYYRIDPSITATTNEKGFWYTNLDGKGFVEHEVTDLSDDQFECRWFYQPKASGKPLWLPPYLTDNLDIYVLSYNVPVYRNNSFVGVVGIEIDYKTMGAQIKDIKVMESGYAYIVSNETGTIIYHPYLDILSMPEEERPAVPQDFLIGFRNGEHHIQYSFEGVTKHSYWLNLSNDMSIVVAVPLSEVNQTWLSVLWQIVVSGLVLEAVFVLITVLYARHITKPLKDLTAAAEEINKGNYNVELTYKRDDEIGVLTTTVNGMIKKLGEYIHDLNDLAYADPLTSVGNKSAFDLRIAELQKQIDSDQKPEFAIAMFDCDELKLLNDSHGHGKGDIYLRNTCSLIAHIFEHSVVYRIGGDEFMVILEGEDYQNREALRVHFLERSAEICAFAKEPWEKIRASVGVATYDPTNDKSANDVITHADHLMYINKRERKKS